MGCVRPFKEGIGFSHHTGVCSKGQTHNLIPSVLKRNRVQILYKKGLRFFQGFSPVGVWLFSLWGTSLFTIRSGDLRGVVGSPCTYNIKLKFWVTYILFVWYYTFSTTFQVRLLFSSSFVVKNSFSGLSEINYFCVFINVYTLEAPWVMLSSCESGFPVRYVFNHSIQGLTLRPIFYNCNSHYYSPSKLISL